MNNEHWKQFIDKTFGHEEFTLEMFAEKSGLSIEEAREVLRELFKAKIITGAFYATEKKVRYQKMDYDWATYISE